MSSSVMPVFSSAYAVAGIGAVSMQIGSAPRTLEVVDAGPRREAVVLHRLLAAR